MIRQLSIVLVAASLAASACDPSDALPSLETYEVGRVDVTSPEGGCSQFVVPQSFGLGWEKFNHRISMWSVRLARDSCMAERLNVRHVGGIFSTNRFANDQPFVKYAFQSVGDSQGGVRAARVTVEDVIHHGGVATGNVPFSLDELGLGRADEYVAIIEGLHLDTGMTQSPAYPTLYNPARGYTTRGLGTRVAAGAFEGGVDLDYRIRLEMAPTPERPFMNSALPHARVGARLDVLIVAVNDRTVRRANVDYRLEHEWTWPFVDPEVPAVEAAEREVRLTGRNGAPAGFYGLSGFDFRLDFDTDCDEETDCSLGATCNARGKCDYGFGPLGEYMRELTVDVRMIDYTAETGEAHFQLNGYASNASSLIAYYPLRYRFTGGMVWIQADGAGERHSLERVFDTGEVEVGLDPERLEHSSVH